MEFFKQESWSGLLFPSPGDLSNPGVKPRSPALQADSLPGVVGGNTNMPHSGGPGGCHSAVDRWSSLAPTVSHTLGVCRMQL